MRNIEEMRLKSPEDDKKYGIPWEDFVEVFEQSSTLEDLSAGIAVYVVQEYLKRGISEEEIEEILLKGYNPKGPTKEHGELESVNRLWNRIFHDLRRGNEEERRIGMALTRPVKQKIEEGLQREKLPTAIKLSEAKVRDVVKRTYPTTFYYSEITRFTSALLINVTSKKLSVEGFIEELKKSVDKYAEASAGDMVKIRNKEDKVYFIISLLRLIKNLPLEDETRKEIAKQWQEYYNGLMLETPGLKGHRDLVESRDL